MNSYTSFTFLCMRMVLEMRTFWDWAGEFVDRCRGLKAVMVTSYSLVQSLLPKDVSTLTTMHSITDRRTTYAHMRAVWL